MAKLPEDFVRAPAAAGARASKRRSRRAPSAAHVEQRAHELLIQLTPEQHARLLARCAEVGERPENAARQAVLEWLDAAQVERASPVEPEPASQSTQARPTSFPRAVIVELRHRIEVRLRRLAGGLLAVATR